MRGKCTATERHPALSLQGNVHPQNIWTRHHQTHMPFHAPINRSEGAFWCVGVHSHIFISTAINGEESGATATKGKQKHLLQHFTGERQEQHKPNSWLHQHKQHSQEERKQIVYPAEIPNTRSRHEGLPYEKTKRTKHVHTSANIQTETQLELCLHYSIPCACFCVCGCCSGGRACMKWSALNVNEGQTQPNSFYDKYWLHFSWANNPRGVRGSPFFLLLLCFCVAVCAARPLVCVRTLREGCRHDGPLSPYVHAVEPCVPFLFASPSSICVLVLRQGCVCVCVPAAVDWSVCRAWCAAYGACLAAALSSCGVPSVCVSAAPLVSPVALHLPHCADQLHTTERSHDDDDVPSAVRPVGTRPVLLPFFMRDSNWDGKRVK
ncbi:hypothetical protein ECC02_011403 [Trypanosoma cruzi]|uniref:Mucin TcMUCII n=1 Tax=Trypanosoma cruzi TaxID=5693 RepID=A0A7J6XPU8_TRYCR|nr:hypothetical protein ECC02_011403 [Trypanosoma cruzi]